MKIIIIGAGLTGLYIGCMLKNINIEFDIYDKSSRPGGKIKTIDKFDTLLECGESAIRSHHLNTVNLINKLKLRSKIVKYQNIISPDCDRIFDKIYNHYMDDNPVNLSTNIYIRSILSNDDYEIFKTLLLDDKILGMEISDFMKYSFYDIQNKDNEYVKIYRGTQMITDRLAEIVKDRLYLNHMVQEITYMPLTGTYLLMINGVYMQADKIILAANLSIKNIRLRIPQEIIETINHIESFNKIKLFTLHKYPFSFVNKQGIHQINEKVLEISSDPDLLYSLLDNKPHTNTVIDKLLRKITGYKLPPIEDYIYCNSSHGFHINKKQIKTNFWYQYNIILAGEWVHPYHNTLEGPCMSAIKTFNIITSQLFIDRLAHEPDNVTTIEVNRC